MGKIQQFTIKAMYSAKDSVSFIKKKGPQLHKGFNVS